MKPSTIKLAKAYLDASNAGDDAQRLAIAKEILTLQQERENAKFFGAIVVAAHCTDEQEADEKFNAPDLRRVVLPAPPAKPLQGASWMPDAPIPRRDWLLEGMLPAGRLSSLYGEGAIGKSLIAMQIAAAVMHGGWPIAIDPELKPAAENIARHAAPKPIREPIGKVLWLTWEDEIDEFRRRWRMAANAGAVGHYDNDANRTGLNADPKNLTLVNMREIANGGPLWAPGETAGSSHISSRAIWTAAGRDFLLSLKGHALAVIDPLAAAFGSNENDRALVRQFTAALDGEAERSNCAVLLIAHPPKSKDSGGYSGSTDWRNSVRASYHLEVSADTAHKINTGKKPKSESESERDKREGAKAYRLVNDKASYSAGGKHLWLRRHYKAAEVDPETKQEKPVEMAWFATTAGNAARSYNPGKIVEHVGDEIPGDAESGEYHAGL